ncbi:hypothetical protein HG536_0A08790 [Torulaspora globosa]|uniref:SPX domain-containing protein n=1 Tax=Torulaspora globosa TaxID=48254 RepID=A0A7G3ZC26_9SACH|nr:uncharacterized protein HG536_0A08790 [Torulaspora globosa]QLL31062.1 hypothetical protein HG536_0A08790 [Torulaspora globosa]
MKFSHSLQFNAVPEWSSKYIAYSHLKKLIYALQKDKLYSSVPAVTIEPETRPLLSGAASHDVYVNRFISALEVELRKIDKFFKSQETGLIANYNELKDDVEEFEQDVLHNRVGSLSDAVPSQIRKKPSRRFSGGSLGRGEEVDDDDEEDDDGREQDMGSYLRRLRSRSRSVSSAPNDSEIEIYQSRSRATNDTSNFVSPVMERKITLKKRLVAIYMQLSELKSFIELNRTGFSKICKKFDKSLDTNIKSEYLSYIEKNSHVFNPSTIKRIQLCITETTITYAQLSQNRFPFPAPGTEDELLDLESAERELSSHLREHVVWERNTVWKDMINLERKAQNVKTESKNLSTISKRYHVKEIDDNGNVTIKAESLAQEVPLPRTFSDLLRSNPLQLLGLCLSSPALIKITAILMCFLTLLVCSPFEDVMQKNCFAILVFASLLWATEAIPLFVTSLLIPLLIVVLPVLKDSKADGGLMEPIQASQFILSTMWSSVIMLLLGGFTLAAALSKYNVAKVLSTYILSSAGTNPKIILLTNMGVALFASMWVSNVAAPVLCYSIIQPLLRTLPRHSSYAKALILGIALASNIGGMASPIASPQNIFSIGLMDPQPSWGEWFMITIPVCLVCVVCIWILLMITFPLDPSLKLLQLHPLKDPFTLQQWFVTIVSLGTIILWCLSNRLTGIFGEMGIISIIPLVIFFGSGLLTSEDFNNFMWTIVILAMGGTTLGKAVTSSGLLSTMATIIKENVEDKPVFVIVLIFGLVILAMATFVSHTVAAMIIVPLMSEIGSNLPSGDHSRLLIMVACLLCSGAMGLPTSGFPNVTAISMIDEVGDRYLTVGSFITRGVPSSFIAYLVVVSLGYGLMKTFGY